MYLYHKNRWLEMQNFFPNRSHEGLPLDKIWNISLRYSMSYKFHIEYSFWRFHMVQSRRGLRKTKILDENILIHN